MVPTHNTWAMLLEPLRHVHNPGFGAVIFRRTYAEIAGEGGLWSISCGIYPYLKARGVGGIDWIFPSGATVGFRHMENVDSWIKYQGLNIAMLGFDELSEFTADQFWLTLASNR